MKNTIFIEGDIPSSKHFICNLISSLSVSFILESRVIRIHGRDGSPIISNCLLIASGAQGRQEGGLGNFYFTELAHALLSLFLFFQKFALSGNITAVAFRGHILP